MLDIQAEATEIASRSDRSTALLRLERVNPNWVPIIKVRNQNAGYNSRFFIRYFVTWWFAPLLQFLGRWKQPLRLIRWLFSGTSQHIGQLHQNRKTYRAMELIYNWSRPKQEIPALIWPEKEKHLWNFFMAHLWEMVTVYGEGARNRFRHVKVLVTAHILDTPDDEEYTALSIGSGSCQAVLEAIRDALRENPKRRFRLHALDMSRAALARTQALALAYEIPHRSLIVETERCKIRSTADLEKVTSGRSYHLIEVVGWSEYQQTAWLKELAGSLRDHLEVDGMLLFNNARPNNEAWFITNIIDWPLDLKTPEVLAEILVGNDRFHQCETVVEIEPTGTFAMGIARRKVS